MLSSARPLVVCDFVLPITRLAGGLMDSTLSYYRKAFLELVEMRMPFGKHQGMRLIDLPEPYVVWLARQGFPPGKLGHMLGVVYEIKVNGLESLFDPFRHKTVLGSDQDK
jgi:uncharacterized protein